MPKTKEQYLEEFSALLKAANKDGFHILTSVLVEGFDDEGCKNGFYQLEELHPEYLNVIDEREEIGVHKQ